MTELDINHNRDELISITKTMLCLVNEHIDVLPVGVHELPKRLQEILLNLERNFHE